MAEVFLGRHISDSGVVTPCAIKRILPTYSDEAGMIALFRDEMLITRSLRHDGIVRVYDFLEIDGAHAMVLEFVDGEDLKSLITHRVPPAVRIPTPLAVLIAADLAAALHYAHSRRDERTGQELGIVHRDVTPENVLIGFDGAVKLTDFGIAFARDKYSKTRPGVIKGKLQYMAPEQARGLALDGRADVFGLCLLLWETLVRKPFFQCERPVDLLQEITESRWRPDVLPALGIDAQLEAIVARGLQADRDERFATAGELEQALRRYLASLGEPTTHEALGAFVSKYAAAKQLANRSAIRSMLANPNGKSSTEDTRSGETRSGETRGGETRGGKPDADGGGPAQNSKRGVGSGLRNPMSRASALSITRPSRLGGSTTRPHRTRPLPPEPRRRRLGAVLVALALAAMALFVSPMIGGPDIKLSAVAHRLGELVSGLGEQVRKRGAATPKPKKTPPAKKPP
jgi:serine/threonine-protein kinase